MEIEQKEVETTETTEEETSETTEETTDSTEVKLTDEEKLARLEGGAKRLRKKLGLEEPAVKKEEVKKVENKKSDEFSEGQLAYLVAKGIEADEDIDFTMQELKKHGGNLRELFGNDYFKTALNARKDAKVTLEATPVNSRRTSSRPSDAIEVEYAKYQKTGKLPADREMREKIVNARLKTEAANNQFTDQSVIQ